MSWIKTDEAGIYRHEHEQGKWKVHATATDPIDGEIVHRRRTLTDAGMEEAVAKREEMKATIRSRDEGQTNVGKSVSDFADRWVSEMVNRGRWSERTAETNRQILEDHIKPRLGDIEVEELGRKEIRRWVAYAESATYTEDEEARRYSHSSLRRWWRVLKQLVKALYLEAHCERRLVEWCRDIRGPQSDISGRRETRTLTADELWEFVDKAEEVAPTRYAEIVTLAFTGMRAGELYGLEWRHVDYERGTILIEQAYSSGGLKSTKTGRSRTAPMVPKVEEALKAQHNRLEREQNLGLTEGIVFPADNGERRFASSLHKPMKRVAERCGIDVKVGPQVLRKTFTTLMGNLGVRREMIKSITGHQTNEMHDHYTEIRPVDQAAAVEKVFGGDEG
jgi:integrase